MFHGKKVESSLKLFDEIVKLKKTKPVGLSQFT